MTARFVAGVDGEGVVGDVVAGAVVVGVVACSAAVVGTWLDCRVVVVGFVQRVPFCLQKRHTSWDYLASRQLKDYFLHC